MDSAMRDLEEIRERDDGEARPLALVAILIGVTVALVLAMGWAVGGGVAEEEPSADGDPLARLDQAAGLEAPAEAEGEPPMPEVDPSDLTFPEVLAPADERPEVAAALAAAVAELAHPDPLGDARPIVPAPAVLPPTIPAAVAAGPGAETLLREAAHDRLIAESMPAAAPGAQAAAGHDGEFTVQVISYDSPEGAEAFAAGLRARGHRAFVMRADVDGRGTVYRVRVGPFETLHEAQEYRHEFERTERMNTLLVHRRDAA